MFSITRCKLEYKTYVEVSSHSLLSSSLVLNILCHFSPLDETLANDGIDPRSKRLEEITQKSDGFANVR